MLISPVFLLVPHADPGQRVSGLFWPSAGAVYLDGLPDDGPLVAVSAHRQWPVEADGAVAVADGLAPGDLLAVVTAGPEAQALALLEVVRLTKRASLRPRAAPLIDLVDPALARRLDFSPRALAASLPA